MRRLALGLGIGAMVAYGLFAWRQGTEPGPRYLTAAADRGPIRATVTATGTVNPVVTVQVGTYVSGAIEAIYADFNTPVHQGQMLAKIDPRPFTVKVDAATADLANAKAHVVKAQADATLKTVTLGRTRALGAAGIVAANDLDLAVSQERQARAESALAAATVRAAEAKLREAEVNLAYTDIVSPVDGVVVSRTIDVGQTVAASFQTPTLFLVAEDLTRMRVLASVSESDIGGITQGQDVEFTVDAYPASTFRGRVEQVRNAPVAVQNVVTYDVVVLVNNTDLRLKPGMTANVTVTIAARTDALRVPSTALRFRPPPPGDGGVVAAADRGDHQEGARVYLLGLDGQPEPVAVSTGIRDDRFTEVTTGLDEGATVVVGIRREAASAAGAPPRGPSFAPGRRSPH